MNRHSLRLAYHAAHEEASDGRAVSGWYLCLVQHNVKGYSQLKPGFGPYTDQRTALKEAAELNKGMGLTPKEAAIIVASSMEFRNLAADASANGHTVTIPSSPGKAIISTKTRRNGHRDGRARRPMMTFTCHRKHAGKACTWSKRSTSPGVVNAHLRKVREEALAQRTRKTKTETPKAKK